MIDEDIVVLKYYDFERIIVFDRQEVDETEDSFDVKDDIEEEKNLVNENKRRFVKFMQLLSQMWILNDP